MTGYLQTSGACDEIRAWMPEHKEKQQVQVFEVLMKCTNVSLAEYTLIHTYEIKLYQKQYIFW